YEAKDLNLQNWNYRCVHLNNKKLDCNKIPEQILINSRRFIFKDKIKVQQDVRLSRFLEILYPKRHRERANVGKAVDMLLKNRFGEEWIKEEQLNFYFEIFEEQITFEEQTDGAEQLCSCLEEESEPIH
ncbi:hypothetical protein ILUMI_12223, partial [Ignelater luminosus]